MALFVTIALASAACGGDDDPELATVPDPTATADAVNLPAGVEDKDAGSEAGNDADPAGEDPAEDDSASDADQTDDEDQEDLTPGGGEPGTLPTPVATSGEPDFTTESKLSTIGLDAVFFGDTPETASERGDIDWVGLPEEGSAPQCYTIQPEGGPSGIIFTVIDSRIERVDVTNPSITTLSGAGVGSTPAQLVELFGRNVSEIESPEGAYVVFEPSDEEDRDFRIIWQTDGVAATSMRAGRVPGVLTDTPCS